MKRSLVLISALATTSFMGVASPANAQTETIIHAFQSSNKYDGANPFGAVVANAAEDIYGTTGSGGTNRLGTVYKLAPPAQPGGEWKQNILYSFSGSDGKFPSGSLLLTKDQIIYGTTIYGASYGTVFSLTPPTKTDKDWTETVLRNFSGGVDGGEPTSGVIMDKNGRLYGTTQFGGTGKVGVIFQLTPPSKTGGSWTERVLHNFTGGADGGGPTGLIFDAAGALYGTSVSGGNLSCEAGCGVVFKLSPPASGAGAWTETILYDFTGSSDGSRPSASLIFDSAGSLYGTTADGGDISCNNGYGCGTVFKLSPPSSPGGVWTESVLYAFTAGTDGFYPDTPVIFDSAGALYGTTNYGGGAAGNASCTTLDDGCGIAFKLTPPSAGSGLWTEMILHTFTGVNDGSYPLGGLTLVGTSLYGTAYEGIGNCSDNAGCGTVFEITQ